MNIVRFGLFFILVEKTGKPGSTREAFSACLTPTPHPPLATRLVCREQQVKQLDFSRDGKWMLANGGERVIRMLERGTTTGRWGHRHACTMCTLRRSALRRGALRHLFCYERLLVVPPTVHDDLFSRDLSITEGSTAGGAKSVFSSE